MAEAVALAVDTPATTAIRVMEDLHPARNMWSSREATRARGALVEAVLVFPSVEADRAAMGSRASAKESLWDKLATAMLTASQ